MNHITLAGCFIRLPPSHGGPFLAKKSKTRVLIEVNGHDRRLMSIREDARGRLLVITHVHGIREHRHTIHTSQASASRAILIHKTVTMFDGRRIERHLLTEAVRDGNFQPVEARTVAQLHADPPYKPMPRDEVVRLTGYNTLNRTLHYSLWVSSVRHAADFPPLISCSVMVAKFSRFAIIIPYCFTVQPSPGIGAFLDFSTSSADRLTPQQRLAGHRPGIARGVPSFQVERTLIRDFNDMIDRPPQRGELLFRNRPIGPEVPKFRPKP